MSSIKRVLKVSIEIVTDQSFTESELLYFLEESVKEIDEIDAATIEVLESHDCVIFDTNALEGERN